MDVDVHLLRLILDTTLRALRLAERDSACPCNRNWVDVKSQSGQAGTDYGRLDICECRFALSFLNAKI